jgi:endonuclease/exonuclease/phosphatase family metal-dependent hydrolase
MKKHYPFKLLLLLSLIPLLSEAQVSISAVETVYTERFNGLANSGTSSDMPVGWSFVENGTNANTTYAAGTGSSNTGNTYSFGNDADRALGGLLSGSLTPTIGASFINNSASIITSVKITYRGEQWRLGFADRGTDHDRLDFEISMNATSLLSGTWTSVDQLDFISPLSAGTVGAINGNAVNTTVSYEIKNLAITPGQRFFIRWLDFNVSQADDGLAIDDFSLITYGQPVNTPAINLSVSTLAFTDVNVNESAVLSYNVNSANLSENISVASTSAAFQLSTDNTVYSSSLMLPASGGKVFVKFTPIMNGVVTATISHASGTVTENLAVSGKGYDPLSNIITIANARSKSVGTKVTVAGRITVANELGNPAYVQDATGGLPVFYAPLASGVHLGDSVIVTGPIGLFNDQKQISGTGIFFQKVVTAPKVIAPMDVTLSQIGSLEGFLVRISDITLVDNSFIFYPQSTEQITDGSNSLDLRIDGDTDIPGLDKPEGLFTVTGVVGRFKTNLQLMPRGQFDLPAAIEPTTSADSIPKSKTLDVVNWNFEFFGATIEQYGQEYGPADEALQFGNIKRVIDSLNADIIAVEEVSDEVLFSQLVNQLGMGFTCSPRYSYSFNGPDDSFPPQKVCLIYNKTIITVLSARPMFESLYDLARTSQPELLPNYPGGTPSSFYSSGRLPFLVNTEVNLNGLKENISFIVIHAKSGATAADRERRLYDAKVLKDSLDANFETSKVVVLGDLNDDLDESIVVGQTSPYQMFVDDAAHYLPITKSLSDQGARSTVSFQDVIDHQIISNDLADEYIPGSVQIIAPFRYIVNYAGTTSDHLPVISRYAFIPYLATITPVETTLTESNTTFSLSVKLDRIATQDIDLMVSAGGNATEGADYLLSSSMLKMTAGSDSITIQLTIVDDLLDEVTEEIVLSILETSVVKPSSASIFITDNDVPVISFATNSVVRAEGSGKYQMKLALSTPAATEQLVSINFYTGNKTEYGDDFITDPPAVNDFISIIVPIGADTVSFGIEPLEDLKHESFEVITFHLDTTSAGLERGQPRLAFFTIIDAKKKNQVFVYPNPSHGFIKLINELEQDDEFIHVEVFNPKGMRIFREEGDYTVLNSKLGNLLVHQEKGAYTIIVTNGAASDQIRVIRN